MKAMSILLVAAMLAAFGVGASLAKAAGARDAHAAAGVVANFGYGLSQLSTDNTGAVIETNFDHVKESSTSPVRLNACSSSAPGGIASYRWSFDQGATTVSTTSCTTTWQRPLSRVITSRGVSLTVVPANTALPPATTVKTITFSDVVIASLGDSAASGEGAPDHIKQGPTDPNPAFVASAECDRSGWAASAQAALTLQRALPNASVHFWHLACSGASISSADSGIWPKGQPNPGGLISPYMGAHGSASLGPQVDRLATLQLQSGLRVDRLLITAGINELHWASIVQACAPGTFTPFLQLNCFKTWQPRLDLATATLPAHFSALAARLAASPAAVAPGSVYLTEYYDPFDTLGPQASFCADPAATLTARTYGTGAIMNPIQTIVRNAATANGWNFIGGLRVLFQGHGACGIDPNTHWVNTFLSSQLDQHDIQGSWHANRAGQTAIAPILFNAIKPGLVIPPPPPTATPVPSVIGQSTAAALGSLRSAGFSGQETDVVDNLCEDIGSVRSQLPRAGTSALPGSTVVIIVGKRPTHPCP
jgi:hypothetical protein